MTGVGAKRPEAERRLLGNRKAQADLHRASTGRRLSAPERPRLRPRAYESRDRWPPEGESGHGKAPSTATRSSASTRIPVAHKAAQETFP